jgi:hypothetical protein
MYAPNIDIVENIPSDTARDTIRVSALHALAYCERLTTAIEFNILFFAVL